ncbi:MAG: hypothetical protein AABX10_03570 [Nanoarchaeota archaeon]
MEKLVLTKEIPSQAYGGRRQVHLFNLEDLKLSPEVWQADPVPLNPKANIELFENPQVALVDGRDIYIGLNTGQTHKVSCFEDHHFESSFPCRFLDTSGLRLERSGIDHLKLTGLLSITSLVSVNIGDRKEIAEASYGGVFELEDVNRQEFLLPGHSAINLTPVSSAVIYEGKLLAVNACLKTPPPFKSIRGDLIDITTGEVVFNRFTPFDGSGCMQARYHIERDRVYLAHGNYPDEKITVIDMKTKKIVGNPVRIFGTFGFAEYQGEVFDMRDRGAQGRNLALVKSIDPQEYPVMDLKGKRVTSFASTKSKGIVVGIYDKDRNATSFSSHLDGKQFAEFEGDYCILPSTLSGTH